MNGRALILVLLIFAFIAPFFQRTHVPAQNRLPRQRLSSKQRPCFWAGLSPFKTDPGRVTSRQRSEHAGNDFSFLTTQPGVAHRAGGCGSENILAGNIYLFLGAFVYLLRRKASCKFML